MSTNIYFTYWFFFRRNNPIKWEVTWIFSLIDCLGWDKQMTGFLSSWPHIPPLWMRWSTSFWSQISNCRRVQFCKSPMMGLLWWIHWEDLLGVRLLKILMLCFWLIEWWDVHSDGIINICPRSNLIECLHVFATITSEWIFICPPIIIGFPSVTYPQLKIGWEENIIYKLFSANERTKFQTILRRPKTQTFEEAGHFWWVAWCDCGGSIGSFFHGVWLVKVLMQCFRGSNWEVFL